jgi:hypothetical protein
VPAPIKTHPMKTPHAIATALLLFLAVATNCSAADEPGATAAEPKIPPERFEAKVIKAYAAQDGAARFRAYVVEWKGQQVIASDNLAKSDYKEGDTVTVLAMNHPYPQQKESYRLLGFSIVPPAPSRR